MEDYTYHPLFRVLKDDLGPQVNLAQWLSDTWKMSRSAVYRRIKGEVPVTLEEWVRVVIRRPSAGMMQSELVKAVNLRIVMPQLITDEDTLVSNLKSLREVLQAMKEDPKAVIYYTARDLPLFYFLSDSQWLAYKLALWNNTLETEGIQPLRGNTTRLAREVFDLYTGIPSKEVWSPMAFESQYNQLLALKEVKWLNEVDFAWYKDSLITLARTHLRWSAEGRKSEGGSLKTYTNPFMTLNNGAVFKTAHSLTLSGALWEADHYSTSVTALIQRYLESFKSAVRLNRTLRVMRGGKKLVNRELNEWVVRRANEG